MKSIMEEASSLMKAIEKGWTTAGQPKEFTIKIYEEAQKNFIGMTTRPAKIGIFFSETVQKPSKQPQAKKARPTEPVREERKREERPQQPARLQKEKAPQVAFTEKAQRTPEPRPERTGPVWTDEMVARTQEHLQEIFQLMDLSHIAFTAQPEHFHLKIQFNKEIYADTKRDKYLFASLAHLLLTMLKREYKRPLKGYKIILSNT